MLTREQAVEHILTSGGGSCRSPLQEEKNMSNETVGQVLTNTIGYIVGRYANAKAYNFSTAARALAADAEDARVASLLRLLADEFDCQTEVAAVVFDGTHDWYEIVSKDGELVLSEPWQGDWEAAAEAAGMNLDDEEAWVARVEEVDERHSAIKVGDYACCQGYGADVVFVRI